MIIESGADVCLLLLQYSLFDSHRGEAKLIFISVGAAAAAVDSVLSSYWLWIILWPIFKIVL